MKHITKDSGHKYKYRHWYAHLSGSPIDPENYYLITSKPLCANGRNICAIYTIGFYEQPEEFSPKMKTAIANAIVTGIPQVNSDNVPIVILKTGR